MANKNFNQFTNQTTLLGTDNLVGFRSTSAGGEFKAPVSSLLNYITPNLAGQPWAVKAWFVGSYRSNADRANVLGQPRIIASYNIESITRNSASRYYVTFPAGLFTSRRYLVLGDAAISNNDRSWVAGYLYRDIPSIDPIGIDMANLTSANQNAHKSLRYCKFESTNAAYLTEFYIMFLGGDVSYDQNPPDPV
jgi:hypothetical protein